MAGVVPGTGARLLGLFVALSIENYRIDYGSGAVGWFAPLVATGAFLLLLLRGGSSPCPAPIDLPSPRCSRISPPAGSTGAPSSPAPDRWASPLQWPAPWPRRRLAPLRPRQAPPGRSARSRSRTAAS